MEDSTAYVGEPLGAVVATDPYTAEDAAELVQIEYEPIKPVTSVKEALSTDSPRIYEAWGDNVAYHLAFRSGDIEGTFSHADYIAKEKFSFQRYTGVPMETRGVIARYEAWKGLLEIWTSNQWPFVFRTITSTPVKPG